MVISFDTFFILSMKLAFHFTSALTKRKKKHVHPKPAKANQLRKKQQIGHSTIPAVHSDVRSVTQHSHNAILNASRAHTKITSFLNKKKKQQHKNTNYNNNERATERKAKERSYRAKVPWRPLNGINQQQQRAREEYKFKCEH